MLNLLASGYLRYLTLTSAIASRMALVLAHICLHFVVGGAAGWRSYDGSFQACMLRYERSIQAWTPRIQCCQSIVRILSRLASAWSNDKNDTPCGELAWCTRVCTECPRPTPAEGQKGHRCSTKSRLLSHVEIVPVVSLVEGRRDPPDVDSARGDSTSSTGQGAGSFSR